MNLEKILQDHFDIKPTKIRSLEGYDSTNFKVESTGRAYVLKVHPSGDQEVALLKAEHLILNKLSSLTEYSFPKPIPSLEKRSLSIEGQHTFRLLTFLEGDFLGDVEHTPALLSSFGRFLAKMDKELLQVYHPAVNGKESLWDLKNFMANRSLLTYIPDPRDRNLVDYFFLQFEQQLLPFQASLRKSIIHNDGNDWNVLTQDGKISGIIDFGDMCFSWLINELAVALTYLLMEKEAPLETAIPVLKAYHEVLPLEKQELNLLYYLIAARLCTSVCNSAYTKTLKPDSEYITISEKPAWALLRKWLSINPLMATNRFRKALGFEPEVVKKLEDQLSKRREHFSLALSLSYDRPIQMHRAAFQYMYDTSGNAILDAYNNIMLAGHAHPKVVRAGQEAMARLNTNTRYVYEELLSYADKLLAKFPSELCKVFFVNSGSAASDLAIRLALAHTKKQKLMVLEEGYHGNTRTGISISNYKYKKKGAPGKKAHIIEAPLPKAFGSGYEDNGEAGAHYLAQTSKLIEMHKGEIAAFIAEPIAGCAGQVPLANAYLKGVYPKIRAQGGVCISDEVQVGFGRLGDHFWGYEMHEVVPDIVILGKPMGNGHPIGAVVTTAAIVESFEEGPEFFSSFGGNPVSCAIGEAVLDVIEEEQLQASAKKVGDFIKDALQGLQPECPQIADVRGSGLFLGVELLDEAGRPDTPLAHRVKNELRENLILISTDGPYDNVLKIKPPLSFSVEDAAKLVEAIRLVLINS